MAIEQNIQVATGEEFERLVADLIEALQDEYKAQGHVLTGRLIKSIDSEVRETARAFEGEISLLPYARYLERGVKARNIPYSPGSGKKSSKYIQALINYFLKRGKGAKESKRAAFATAMKHKKEGMPTRSSFRFSKNGRRKFAIRETIEGEGKKIVQKFSDRMAERISSEIESIILDNSEL
jgi:hypothetical protein